MWKIEQEDLEELIRELEEIKDKLFMEMEVLRGARAYYTRQYMAKKEAYQGITKIYDALKESMEDEKWRKKLCYQS